MSGTPTTGNPASGTPTTANPATGTSTTGNPTAELSRVSVFYGEVLGLSNVTLALEPGITGLVGPNGSGKTTLMRVLVGLIAPQEGETRVLGRPPFTDAKVRSRITLVPATENFFESLSGRRNLELALAARGHGAPAARTLAARALDVVQLTADGDRRYGTWSRGMRQRLKLGVAFASESELVLLDEPFLGVDPPSRKHLRDHILALAAARRTVLVSSHILHEVEALTDRVGILAGGRLLGFGRIDALLSELRDQHPHRVRLEVDDPRRLGVDLLELPHIRELRVTGPQALEFVTERPELAYRELAGLVVASGTAVRRVDALDNTLEAVFRHVTGAGTRRL